ncbi:MAG TPA: hypothetical protein ENK71_01785 [Epsilonproteobacteria bacterium]|nr:hypothetical protein [Campylobacterota bacterium]
MISIRRGLFAKYPTLKKIYPVGHILGWLLEKVVHQDSCNHIIESNREKPPFEFNRAVLESFKAKFDVEHLERIPKTGRVMIIANHPLGALEALALMEMVGQVRQDVKIVANDLLMYVEPLNPLFLPVDVMNAKTARESIANIIKALKNEEVVIIFPAGEVSRKTEQGIRDGIWNRGFLRFARKAKAPILPVKVEATNSWYFYFISKISKPLSSLLLPDQMFRREGKPMVLHIGEMIPYEEYSASELGEEAQVEAFKERLYQMA